MYPSTDEWIKKMWYICTDKECQKYVTSGKIDHVKQNKLDSKNQMSHVSLICRI
jgi:hypothetical protein